MTSREPDLEGLLERTLADPDLRARLIADPKTTLEQELGLELPEDADIRVLEEAPHQLHLILPNAPSRELADDELEQAAGGLSLSQTFFSLRSLRSRYVGGALSFTGTSYIG